VDTVYSKLRHCGKIYYTPQIRSMVETLAAKMASRDEIDAGERRMVDF